VRGFWKVLRAPTLGVVLSLVLCAGMLLAVGENPWVLWEVFDHTFLTSFGLGYTLFYATPLIFTGLAVAICFHCGLFNIGAEGQLYVGSVAIIWVAGAFPGLGWYLAVPLAVLFSFLGGALWGGIAGGLKATRGSHEVIVTILLNFIGMALVDYLVLYTYRNPEVQNTETLPLPDAYTLPLLSDLFAPLGLEIFKSTPANVSLFIALLATVAVYLFLFRTTVGYELRAVGANPIASRFAGIRVNKNVWLALAMGGGLAGLVGVNEVMGYQHKLLQSFSPGYGFTGIAVALLARNHPFGIILSALLFASLHNSARELEFLSDKVSKELSLILQGILIAFVASDFLLEKFFQKRRKLGTEKEQ